MKPNQKECSSSFDPIKTLVLDWGNTVMKVFPEFQGAMVNWPKVECIDSMKTALEALHGQYRIVLATNASDSSAQQVKEALKRARIDQYFDEVFTSHELNGFKKPEMEFFRTLEHKLGEPAKHLIMIGDNYRTDILGANQAGWRTLWYNPEYQPCPGLAPLHIQEIYSMEDLPRILNENQLPDWNTCFNWLQEQKASALLLLHIQAVSAVAYQLALWLRAAGRDVNPILAQRGGFLHDMAKLLSLRTGASSIDHGRLAAQLLIACGQPELAEIARRHLLFCLIDEDRKPETWEQKVVYFADKLIEGTELSSLENRLQSLRERYPHDKERISAFLPALLELQEEICEAIHIDSQDLLPNLRSAMYGEEN